MARILTCKFREFEPAYFLQQFFLNQALIAMQFHKRTHRDVVMTLYYFIYNINHTFHPERGGVIVSTIYNCHVRTATLNFACNH